MDANDAITCPGCLKRDRRIAELEQCVASFEAQAARLTRKIEVLTSQLDESRRAGKRQAAPFSKGAPKPDPKTPGRKAGAEHGTHSHRPPPDHIDEVLEATLPDACPHCGGHIAEDDGVDELFQTEIPNKPIIRKFLVHKGCCDRCGKRIRGRHPLQTSDAVGAAASSLGADAQASIVYLNKDAGLSHGKIAHYFQRILHIPLTRGACAQIVLRAAHKLQPVYDEIKDSIKHSSRITPDETGWRLGGHSVWLHTWVGDQAACYVIDPQRSADALEKVIGIDYSGTLIHDGFASYDRFLEAQHQQCVAHPLRRAHNLELTQIGRAKVFPRQVIDLFQGAIQVRDEFLLGHFDQADLDDAYDHFVGQLLDLTDHPRANQANQTFVNHLDRHAAEWLVFLIDPSIPATNYQAEQALRGPIVNRKVWGGNRTAAGAEAQSIICSVLQTCKQQGLSAFQFLADTFRGVATSLLGNFRHAPSDANKN